MRTLKEKKSLVLRLTKLKTNNQETKFAVTTLEVRQEQAD